jgi:hypothetical protein
MTKGSIARLIRKPPDSAGSHEACAAARDLEDLRPGHRPSLHLGPCRTAQVCPSPGSERHRYVGGIWSSGGVTEQALNTRGDLGTSASGKCSEPGQREELHGEELVDSALVVTMGCQARQDLPVPEPLPDQ